MRIHLLGEAYHFPDVSTALEEPNGLLAAGGDLHPQRLVEAYRHGIFPWFNEDEPILWWSPSPRSVLTPLSIRVSRSTFKAIRKSDWQFSVDNAFENVIYQCAEQRFDEGTWISEAMMEAYITLHTLGYAHSFEVWHQGALVGGLYGVHIGGAFFGESMFHSQSNASKAAVMLLQTTALKQGIELIDCQLQSEHLDNLGAQLIERRDFSQQLAKLCVKPHKKNWFLALHCAEEAIKTNKKATATEA